MGGGNGAKAKTARERKQAEAAGSVAKSQLKVNEQAKDIQCKVCKATFLKTARKPALTEHATNKHSKTVEDCFPDFKEGGAEKPLVAKKAAAPKKP